MTEPTQYPFVGECRELERVTTPIETARAGAVRTDAAVSSFRVFLDEIQAMHVKNDYVPRLRAIFRGN